MFNSRSSCCNDSNLFTLIFVTFVLRWQLVADRCFGVWIVELFRTFGCHLSLSLIFEFRISIQHVVGKKVNKSSGKCSYMQCTMVYDNNGPREKMRFSKVVFKVVFNVVFKVVFNVVSKVNLKKFSILFSMFFLMFYRCCFQCCFERLFLNFFFDILFSMLFSMIFKCCFQRCFNFFSRYFFDFVFNVYFSLFYVFFFKFFMIFYVVFQYYLIFFSFVAMITMGHHRHASCSDHLEHWPLQKVEPRFYFAQHCSNFDRCRLYRTPFTTSNRTQSFKN